MNENHGAMASVLVRLDAIESSLQNYKDERIAHTINVRQRLDALENMAGKSLDVDRIERQITALSRVVYARIEALEKQAHDPDPPWYKKTAWHQIWHRLEALEKQAHEHEQRDDEREISVAHLYEHLHTLEANAHEHEPDEDKKSGYAYCEACDMVHPPGGCDVPDTAGEEFEYRCEDCKGRYSAGYIHMLCHDCWEPPIGRGKVPDAAGEDTYEPPPWDCSICNTRKGRERFFVCEGCYHKLHVAKEQHAPDTAGEEGIKSGNERIRCSDCVIDTAKCTLDSDKVREALNNAVIVQKALDTSLVSDLMRLVMKKVVVALRAALGEGGEDE